MNRTVQKLLWCFLSLATLKVFGQEIKVVVLDAQNGGGVGNAVVWVQYYEAPANRVLQRIQYKTGPDGIAHILLTEAQSAQLSLSVLDDAFRCGGFVNAATADIVKNGAISQCGSKSSNSLPMPKPGEVMILVRRMPWWRRLLAPLEKD
jgi:hypothetical protein